MKKSIIVSILLLVLGLGITVSNYLNKKTIEKEETQQIETFFKKEITGIEPKTKTQEKYDYIAVLEIPSINLKKGLVSPDSIHNNVEENITILSEMPDKTNIFILAAHSGTADISYFRNLNKLEKNDYIYVYYKNNKYIYKVNNYYEEDKPSITIKNKSDVENIIVLTTCKPITNDKQLTYVAHLEGTFSY